MCAAIRQTKAKPAIVDELARRTKTSAIAIIGNVPGFMGYYVFYYSGDTVATISVFNDFAGLKNQTAGRWRG